MTLSTALIVRTHPGRGKGTARHAAGTLAGNAVAVIAAASAGVHAGLVPEHLREAGPRLGGAFALSAFLLAAVGLLAARRPSRRTWAVAAIVLAGVAIAYVLSRTSGIPFLLADPEAPDRLGVITTGAETVAALAAALLALSRKEGP
jgi:hypothetical protein